MNQEANRLKRLRRKADKLGYTISKGYVHYLHGNGSVYYNEKGEKEEGYTVTDNRTGFSVWGSYNEVYDHLWSLEDVERFLNEQEACDD